MRNPIRSALNAAVMNAVANSGVYDADGFPVVSTGLNRLSATSALDTDIVVSSERFLAATGAEPTIDVLDKPDENGDRLPLNSREADMVRRIMDVPNPDMTGRQFRGRLLASCGIIGSSYGVLTGPPTRDYNAIWPVSALNMQVHRDPGSGRVLGYEIVKRPYTGVPGITTSLGRDTYPPEQVIRFRLLPHELDAVRSIAPLESVLPLLDMDREATEYTRVILHNLGTGTIISPNEDYKGRPDRGAEDAIGDLTKAKKAWDFLSDRLRRGSTVIMKRGVTVQHAGFPPKDVLLPDVHEKPESRGGSVFGIPVSLLGWQLGVENSPWSHLPTARKFVIENTAIPLANSVADSLTRGLLRTFTGDGEIVIDERGYRALREDVDAQWVRVRLAYQAGMITLNQALTQIGLQPIGPDGDVYFVPTNGFPMPASSFGDLTERTE